MRSQLIVAGALAACLVGPALAQDAAAPAAEEEVKLLTGPDAFVNWDGSKPGQAYLIRPNDLPEPFATESAGNPPGSAPRTAEDIPQAPEGFTVSLFAEGLQGPRTITVAPDGTIFVVESTAGAIRTIRMGGDGSADESQVFADGLSQPYGLAFYPIDDPEWVYVGETDKVVRFPYKAGDRTASGEAEVIIPELPSGGHWTRDIVFSPDGEQMFIAVGSESNVAEDMGELSEDQIKALEAERLPGALWDTEDMRAAVLVAKPDGSELSVFATGIRNCSGLAIEASTGSPWCATNERDGLGDNLPSDYVTRVQRGGFYGWPWFYIGQNQDPRHDGARADLRQNIVVPDVLIQAHSAPLGLDFYDGDMFPEEYRGNIFVALHGSWNRGKRTGYKVVRVEMQAGQPTGVYQDFLTGFVKDDATVWGRPVGIDVAPDGSLLVSEDEAGTIWRVTTSQ